MAKEFRAAWAPWLYPPTTILVVGQRTTMCVMDDAPARAPVATESGYMPPSTFRGARAKTRAKTRGGREPLVIEDERDRRIADPDRTDRLIG